MLSNTYASCANKELVNGWGGEWTPFIMGTAKKPSGLDMDILNAVIDKAGCKWRNTQERLPWARHLKLVELGKVDLATAASWTKEREEYAYFTEPYRTEYVAIYILEESFERFSGMSLNQLINNHFKLGTVRGDVYGKTMERLVYGLRDSVYVVDENDQNYHKLQLGRIDGYIGFPPYDTVVVNQKNSGKKVVVLPSSVTPTGKVHIMLSKKNNSVEVFESLNQAVIDLQKDGTIKNIKAKYGSQFNTNFY